tara:strand:+ start:3357 stop:4970 length:1614 start_codon:yes stop_codon:yes gene_type:complete
MSVPTISKSILTDRNAVYTAEDIIEIEITPSEVPLLNTSQGTYLKFLLKIKEDSNCLAQPDPMAGGSACIQTVSIYSNGGQLLEQLEDFNVWTSMQHHYSKSQGLANMRTLMEGVSPVVGRSHNSQYWKGEPITGITYKVVECVVALNMSGLLGEQGKLLPIVALGGIRVRLQLAKDTTALRALTQAGYSSTGATYTGISQVKGLPTSGSLPAQTFECAVAVVAGAGTQIQLNSEGILPALSGVDTIEAIVDTRNINWMVGQEVWAAVGNLATPANPVFLGAITAIGLNATGNLEYTFAGFNLGVGGIPIGTKFWVDGNSLSAEFQMTNVEFICSVVQASPQTMNGVMKQVSSGSGLRIDYPSYNLYRQNLQAKIPRSELLIPATEQRAMSIVSQPMRSISRIFQDTLRPVGDDMTSYIWNIANRLTPNRRVDVGRVAGRHSLQDLKWNSIHLHETEKAIGRCDIDPRNLCENARCFAVCRELAKQGHSFDANTNEIRLNVEYSSVAEANVINKLVDTWLYHIRTVIITPGSVAVEF